MNPTTFEALVQKQVSDCYRVRVVPQTQSTNDDIKALAETGEPAGAVLIALRQTGGRGRMGRKFHSPPGTGLYLSVLLRPDALPEESVFLTTSAAVAAARGVKTVFGKDVSIKWVNDLYLEGKKVCGILTEAGVDGKTGRLEYAVCGIGFNLVLPEGGFPEEISAIAGALSETLDPNDAPRLAAAFLNELQRVLQESRNEILEEYRSRSLLTGKKVTSPTGAFPGVARVLGIDDSAGLTVRLESGEVRVLNSGEVSVRLERGDLE